MATAGQAEVGAVGENELKFVLKTPLSRDISGMFNIRGRSKQRLIDRRTAFAD